MVVFTCGHCGESVQKPKVEKHYMTKCRNRNPNLSCMDCFKDFLGPEYEAHNKCVSEEQRYAAKGFVAKPNKGEQKQSAWVEMVQTVLDEQKNAPNNVIRIIEEITKHSNTPRKKPKFINFVKNVCGHRTNIKDIESAWDLISVKLSGLTLQNQNKQNGLANKKNDSSVDPTTDVNDNEDGEGVKSKDECPEDTEGKVNESETAETEIKDEAENLKSKKQRKQDKKKKKYEAALQSASVQPPEETEETAPLSNKEKKKKKKAEQDSANVVAEVDPEEVAEENGKKLKKRKRLDTVVQMDVPEEPEVVASSAKTIKKKAKIADQKQLEDNVGSLCLNDRNAEIEEDEYMKPEKFNWHAVIVSLLQKKGNELPLKRLQKKVLTEYSEATGQLADDRIADKLFKKLRSAPNIKVDKNRVMLMD